MTFRSFIPSFTPAIFTLCFQIVILLGWFGAKESQLAKFSNLHNSLGRDTLQYTLPSSPEPLLFTYDQSKQREIAERLAARVDDRSKVLIHSLSNNGFTMYQHLIKLLPRDKYDISGDIVLRHVCPKAI